MNHIRQGRDLGIATVLMVAWTSLALVGGPAAAQQLEVVTITGDPAPDGNGQIDTYSGSGPALNDLGQVAFKALLSGTTGVTTDNSGIFLGDGGPLTQIAREGAAVTGGGTIDFLSSGIALNDAGDVALVTSLLGTPLNTDSGIYRGDGGPLEQIAREGQSAPDLDGVFGDLFGAANVYINTSGEVGFKSFITGGTNGEGVFVGTSELFFQIAREDDAAPAGGGSFEDFENQIAINDSVEVTFNTFLTGTANDVALYRGDGFTTVELARKGDAAPDANGTIDDINPAATNEADQVAFIADFANTTGGTADDQGLILITGGVPALLVREGDAALDGNGKVSSLLVDPALNEAGQVAVRVAYDDTAGGGDDNTGLLLWSNSQLTQLVREGEESPDSGVEFGQMNAGTLNESGYVVFTTGLTGAGVDASNDRGLYITNGIDEMKVIREGDAYDGATVVDFDFADGDGPDSTERNGFNNADQIAFAVILDNGDEAVLRYSIPDIRWDISGSGNWSSDPNWTFDTEPNSFHDTFIEPDSGATINGTSTNTIVKSLTIGATTSGVAVLNVDNGGDLESLGDITVNARGRINVGTNRVLTAQTIVNGGVLSGDGQVDAQLDNQAAGQVLAESGQSLHVSGSAAHTNAGVVEAINAEIRFAGTLTNSASTGLVTGRDAVFRFDGGLDNDGAVALSFGTSDVHGDITNDGSIIVSGNGNATFYDDVTNNAVINVSTGSTAVFFGSLSGNGVAGAGTVFEEGDTRPGASPGEMIFGGDLNFGFFHTLNIELGGPTPGTQFDRVVVNNALSLSGALDVALINGFNPQFGDSFTILTANTVTGAFDTENLPVLGGIFALDVVYNPGSVVLDVIAQLLLGDANNDGQVTGADLIAVQQNFGNVEGGPTTGTLLGDANDDGQVTGADLISVQQNFGNVLAPAPGSVPEPGTMGLVLIGVLSLLRRSPARGSTELAEV